MRAQKLPFIERRFQISTGFRHIVCRNGRSIHGDSQGNIGYSLGIYLQGEQVYVVESVAGLVVAWIIGDTRCASPNGSFFRRLDALGACEESS